jgi:16S rRNA (guanine966-N2)-methyltransferase
MRIIAGTLRHRRLLPPKDSSTTRPITDRVKQSLFDRLTSMEMYGSIAIDIFAGTGSLGLEAISRGVDLCVFIEKDRPARQALEANIDSLGVREKSRVIAADALSPSWLALLPFRAPAERATLIFCDPPYPLTQDEVSMAKIATLIERMAAIIEPDGLLTLRTDSHTKPPAVPGWLPAETLDYGSMHVHFYRPAPAMTG